MVLADLKPGQTAIVDAFETTPLVLKFLEIGIVPGAEVLVINQAAFGGPMAIEITGTKIGLRKKEARTIKIRLN